MSHATCHMSHAYAHATFHMQCIAHVPSHMPHALRCGAPRRNGFLNSLRGRGSSLPAQAIAAAASPALATAFFTLFTAFGLAAAFGKRSL